MTWGFGILLLITGIGVGVGIGEAASRWLRNRQPVTPERSSTITQQHRARQPRSEAIERQPENHQSIDRQPMTHQTLTIEDDSLSGEAVRVYADHTLIEAFPKDTACKLLTLLSGVGIGAEITEKSAGGNADVR